jgi:hypothetical protein
MPNFASSCPVATWACVSMAKRRGARPDASQFLDALGLNRVDPRAARLEGAVDLVVALGDAAEDDLLGRETGLENEPELGPRNDVGAAPLIEKRAQHGDRRVRLGRESDERWLRSEPGREVARCHPNGIEIVEVGRCPTSRRGK